MGITGTEVSKEAAVMILTDDDFSTIVHAVRLGRNLYDNLKKYIRFQMAGLFGFIATFLGSSIFWIAGGVPFLPTQTIWVNFSVQVAAAFGLGFGAPTKGLMDRKPRPADAPILSQRMLVYLAVVGLFMGLGTLLVLELATREWSEEVGRSMALATFSFMNIAFALSTKDLRQTVFSEDTLADRTLLLGTGAAILVTILASQLGLLQRLLGTVPLSWDQWLICALVGFLILVVAEIRKLLAPGMYADEE
jgi:Ca2+-transporting ATPase